MTVASILEEEGENARILKNRWQRCGADRRGKLTQGDSASPRIVS
jgi:hypothetical protein